MKYFFLVLVLVIFISVKTGWSPMGIFLFAVGVLIVSFILLYAIEFFSGKLSNKDKYYKITKDLTSAIKQYIKDDSNGEYRWKKTFNNINLIAWVQHDLTTFQIRIIDNVSYEYSLDFNSSKFEFTQTTFEPYNTIYLDTFDSEIEVIMLNTLSQALEFLSSKIGIDKKEIEQKKDEYLNLIDSLASDIIIKRKAVGEVPQSAIVENIESKKINNSKYLIIEAVENQDIALLQKITNEQNINEQNEKGDTPLIISILYDTKRIKSETNKYRKNKHKKYAIKEIESKKFRIIEFLLKEGANPNIKNNYGYAPLEIVLEKKDNRILNLINHYSIIDATKNQDNIGINSLNKALSNVSKNDDINELYSINKLKDEVKTIKNSDEDNNIEELKLQIDAFRETISSQSNEIKELQNKLILKEENTKNIIDDFILKVNKLEKKLNKQKVLKTKIPINISVKKHSIKKDDGVIVKRESFDDF